MHVVCTVSSIQIHVFLLIWLCTPQFQICNQINSCGISQLFI
uniref:Uncharacterized protein n=1 Tax=Anguilla anguilla TaxID=7936 RepID=A0A0E9SBR6_ANGAN